jgi:hypothetical protein
MNFNYKIDGGNKYFLLQFKNPTYYWMWPFKGLEKDFDDAVVKIKSGQHPFEDPIFDILDELVLLA